MSVKLFYFASLREALGQLPGKGWVKRKSVQMPKRPYMRPSAEAGWRWFRQELPRRLEA